MSMFRRAFSVFVMLSATWQARISIAADEKPDETLPNWELPTFGGLQYWADELIFHDYRIQRSVTTGHFRLLDGDDVRQAWGTFEQCRTKLDEIKTAERLKPLPKRVVLMLHGMVRTRHSMSAVADYLRDHGHVEVLQIGYPSTQEGIPAHAATLDRLIRRLDGVEEIDIVAYSMGNLVTRHWLGDVAAEESKRLAEAATDEPPRRPRLRRYVMLGPPNNGAQRAKLWAESPVMHEMFKLVVGEGGDQLGPRYDEIKDRLVIPKCEFGIIAGGKGDGQGWHTGIPGDDDGTVGVEETKIAGATDFAVVPVRHLRLITEEPCLRMVHSFLENGYFTTAEARNSLRK